MGDVRSLAGRRSQARAGSFGASAVQYNEAWGATRSRPRRPISGSRFDLSLYLVSVSVRVQFASRLMPRVSFGHVGCAGHGRGSFGDGRSSHARRLASVRPAALSGRQPGKPFFLWLNPTRMHVVTHLSPNDTVLPRSGIRRRASATRRRWPRPERAAFLSMTSRSSPRCRVVGRRPRTARR